jgi:hypothetical protein
MVGQTQAGENGFHFLVYIPAAEAFDASLQARHFVKRLALFDPGALNEAVVSAEKRAQLADARCHYLENSLFRVGRHFLFQMSNAQAISAPDLSFIRSGASRNDAKKSGFSGAVPTHDANSFARIDLKFDLGE